MVDGVHLGSCDSNSRTAEPQQDWTKELADEDPDHLKWNTDLCRENRAESNAEIQEIQVLLNQTGGMSTFCSIGKFGN